MYGQTTGYIYHQPLYTAFQQVVYKLELELDMVLCRHLQAFVRGKHSATSHSKLKVNDHDLWIKTKQPGACREKNIKMALHTTDLTKTQKGYFGKC